MILLHAFESLALSLQLSIPRLQFLNHLLCSLELHNFVLQVHILLKHLVDALLVFTELPLQFLILLVFEHYLLEGGEETVGKGFFAGADGGNGLRGKLLWSIAADVRVMVSIAHLLLVLKLLDLSVEALVLLLEVVVYLH